MADHLAPERSFVLLFRLVAWCCGMLMSVRLIVPDEASFRRYGRRSDQAIRGRMSETGFLPAGSGGS